VLGEVHVLDGTAPSRRPRRPGRLSPNR
jgi:hypothetical protein